ncbi:alpha/beta hydrolase [Salipiger sp. IMCC34102]|uniref:alpha/beta fold hydrolase n=1 Tax=Salipiger sp. IMCC34102 TaxID=2510647 RepID=UPI00101D7131|nr:alpha/beta hydrolase [Salipiger sp. IMCC34102]RYH02760.1 alpha/beta hydrolase [Salipiger sp. IMCC34102]
MRLAARALTFTALALGLGSLVTGCTASYRADRAEEAFPPLGQFVTLESGARVHYLQAGSGPDLVLIHGAGGNLRDWTFDLFDILAQDYRVTAFDRPGLGYTDRFPGLPTGAFATEGESPLQQAQMLREASAQLGIERPIVAGHSFGGIAAYQWALMGLDANSAVDAAAVVSFAGVAMPWPGELGPYYQVNGSAFGGAVTVPILSAFVPASTVEEIIENTFSPQPAPEGYADFIGAPLTLRLDSFRANVRQVNTLRPHVVEMERRYPQLTLPIEIVHGTADTTVPIDIHSDEIVKLVPTANLTRLEGVGHMPHHVAPDVATAAIDRAAARAGLR